MKTDAGKPLLVIKEVPVCQGLTTKILARYDTIIFWATVQGLVYSRMGVIKLPESFCNLLISPEFAEVFATMGLTRVSQLVLNGIDIPRVYEMMDNLTEGGANSNH